MSGVTAAHSNIHASQKQHYDLNNLTKQIFVHNMISVHCNSNSNM